MVGVATNVAGYLVYLLVTYLGGTPKVTMTVLYLSGAAAGFWGNRRLTFAHQGSALSAAARYILAQSVGYLLNLALLLALVDRMGLQHQLIQAIAIPVVAAVLFPLYKYFVFRNVPSAAAGSQ